MRVRCTYDKIVSISELKLNPKNRNIHPPEQIRRLAEILNYQGWRYPVKVSLLSGLVTSGHGRIEAAKLNNWTEVPVNFQEYENSAQEFADLTADNAIALWAELDEKGIGEDYKEFELELDSNLLGLEEFNPESLTENQGDPDEVPEVKDAICQAGELWILGEHRLLCGDSTRKEDIERLMSGEKADMVFTDPPYGMNLDTDYKNSTYSNYDFKTNSAKRNQIIRSYRPVIGDSTEFSPTHLLNICEEVFLWGADYYCDKIPKGGSWIVWDKTGGHESLDKSGFGSNFELCWSKKSHKRDIARVTYKGVAGMKPEDGNRVHPTQKPVGLAQWFFERWGKDAKIIWDGYLGSGSTLIACEKTNRKCYGMEIDPHYCDIIIARWEKFTGKKAVKNG